MRRSITQTFQLPSPEEFQQLRIKAGLSPRNPEYIAKALQNSYCCVTLWQDEKRLIGMGRIIGDGGTAYQVVDIAVDPEFQGKGLGKQIMTALKCYIDSEIPKEAYISLIADGTAKHLYRQFDFEETLPESAGMYFKRT